MSHQENSGSLTELHENESSHENLDEISEKDLISFCEGNNAKQLANLISREIPGVISKDIPTSDLEMLEAELCNQGIVRESSESIFSLVVKDMATVRWTLKSTLGKIELVRFTINVDEYLKSKAFELYQSTENGTLDPQKKRLLQYLDQFAAYQNGVFNSPTNRYERALNLVLQSLAKNHNRTDLEDSVQTVRLPLPKTVE